MAELSEASSTESPLVRGTLWRSLQALIYVFFRVWLGYRAAGYQRVECEDGALILINHQSFLDPLLVGLPFRRPISYLARENLFDAPVIGSILKRTHVLPINQEAAGTASMRKLIERVKAGWLVGIFPEGTRTASGGIGQIKPGFATIVRRAKKPVYPVAVSGAFQALPMGSWFIKPVKVRVIYGKPITVEELDQYPDRSQEDALIELVRIRMIECYEVAENWRLTGILPAEFAEESKPA